jgi:uroporphyrinogen decarboxylase
MLKVFLKRLSINQFLEFIAPFLERLIKGYRDKVLYTIKHTDGNIMPIIDQLIKAKTGELHSLDPQAGGYCRSQKIMWGKIVP